MILLPLTFESLRNFIKRHHIREDLNEYNSLSFILTVLVKKGSTQLVFDYLSVFSLLAFFLRHHKLSTAFIHFFCSQQRKEDEEENFY